MSDGFPGSTKTYLQGSRPDLQVPMREVRLTTGDSVVLYDTSGPYTDLTKKTDIRLGLPRLREAWIAELAALPVEDATARVRSVLIPAPRALPSST